MNQLASVFRSQRKESDAPKQILRDSVQKDTKDIIPTKVTPVISEKHLEILRRGIASYRMRVQQKEYAPVRKLFRYRKNVIAEILNTEGAYVRDLQIVIDTIYNNVKLLPEQVNQVFSNFREVLGTNKLIEASLVGRVGELNQAFNKNYKHPLNIVTYGQPYASIFDAMLINIKLFETYYHYCVSFAEAQKYRTELRRIDQQFNEQISQAEKSPQFRGLDLEGFMVKPVQRLPKYVLLLKDLLKHTPNTHLDYQNIEQCLTTFENMNNKNNEMMDDFMNELKLQELQKQFGTNKQIINISGRRFIFEEALTYYISPSDQRPAILYIFSDAALVVEREHGLLSMIHQQELKYKVTQVIHFNYQSQCLMLQDSKYYQNMFKICGHKKIVNFIANSEKSRTKLINDIGAVIKLIRQKQLQCLSDKDATQKPDIVVRVEGTEEHNMASLSRYTVYVISIQMNRLIWRVYIRYSEIMELYNYIQSHYKSIKIQPLLKVQWLNNHNNKYLEQRKISVENFIQAVMESKEIEERPEPIFKRLSLPYNFFSLYTLLEQDNKLESQKTLNLDSGNLENPYLTQFQIQLNIQKLISEAQQSKLTKTNIQIYLPMKEKSRTFSIEPLTKAIELCYEIALELNLMQCYDYRLFVTDSQGNTRPLDNSQVVMQSLPNDPTIFGQDSVMDQVKTVLYKTFDEVYRVEFKKYLTLNQTLEEYEYRQDPYRLQLMADQIFNDIRNQVYRLMPDEYIIFYALYLIITPQCKKEGDFYDETQILESLNKIVPQQIVKTHTKSEWKKSLLRHLRQFSYRLSNTALANHRLCKQSQQQMNPDVFTQKEHLARMMVIYAIQCNPLYGVTLFYVGIDLSDVQQFEQIGINVQFNIFIGVSYKDVQLLGPSRKELLCSIPYADIIKVVVEPLQIRLEVKLKDTESVLTFSTTQSYRIYQTISEYNENERNK